MNKNDLLKTIAQGGYRIAYAANLNFSTYDMVVKAPGLISFFTIVAGILGIGWPQLAPQWVSAMVLIVGIISIYIEKFTTDIESYKNRGIKNTGYLNKLKELYLDTKNMDNNADFQAIEEKYMAIEQEFNNLSQPDQILFANWLAHFKLFCEKDVSWMDEQLKFNWWKDKIPQTGKFAIFMIIIIVAIYYCVKVPCLNTFFKNIFYIN